MENAVELFKKSYDAEGLYDLERDISEALNGQYNIAMEVLPTNDQGFTRGSFEVTVVWRDDEQ